VLFEASQFSPAAGEPQRWPQNTYKQTNEYILDIYTQISQGGI
jgi:hypothetical protein